MNDELEARVRALEAERAQPMARWRLGPPDRPIDVRLRCIEVQYALRDALDDDERRRVLLPRRRAA